MSANQYRRFIREGSCIHIKGVHGAHPSARRLTAMGFDTNCDILVERLSPFGDPCMVKLKGYSLAVRRRDFEALDIEDEEETEV